MYDLSHPAKYQGQRASRARFQPVDQFKTRVASAAGDPAAAPRAAAAAPLAIAIPMGFLQQVCAGFGGGQYRNVLDRRRRRGCDPRESESGSDERDEHQSTHHFLPCRLDFCDKFSPAGGIGADLIDGSVHDPTDFSR